MIGKVLTTLLLLIAGTAQAVSIYPNVIELEGQPGAIASVQMEVYGHPSYETIEFVKVESIRDDNDQVLATFALGSEDRSFVPIDIVIPNIAKEYYICAVLKNSQSMRLRVCSLVRAVPTLTQ